MFSAAGTIRQPVTRGFSDELLSLRGVAAFMVLVYHVGLIFPHGPTHLSTDLWADGRVLMLWLSSGSAWVTFFFVHSGFVLTLSLNDRLTLGRTGRFYLRRIFRLWPMVAFSSAASLAYLAAGFAPSSNPVFSPWFRAILDPQAGDLGLLRNLALASAGLNWFFWSLQVEAVASGLLPFFVYTARYFLPSCLLVIGLYFLILCLPLPKQFVDGAHSAIGSPLIAYLLCFMAGSISAYLQPEIGRVIRAIGPNVILALSLVLLVATRWLIADERLMACLQAAASVFIVFVVYYCDEGPLQRFLRLPVVKFYGEISYSFYVNSLVSIHLAGLLLVGFADPTRQYVLATGGSLVVAVIINTGLSGLTYRFIELPMMRSGRRMADKLGALQIAMTQREPADLDVSR